MTTFFEVVIPRLGVNEEEVLLTEWVAPPGGRVTRGQVIAHLETSKAAYDLEAEEEGYLYPLFAAGTRVTMTKPVALILDEPDKDTVEEYKKRQKAATRPEYPHITAKAAELARRHSLDLSLLPKDRIVRERDVLALLKGGDQEARASAPAPHTVAIYGASQGGLAVLECFRSRDLMVVSAFIDDDPAVVGKTYHGLPVWPGSLLQELKKKKVEGLATHIMNARFRMQLRDKAAAAGLAYVNAVHAKAIVSPTAKLGVGNVIKAGAVIDAYVQIGDCCIIDNGVILPHHNRIGNACHIAPGACFGGDCEIGDFTVVGIGAAVAARTRIGSNVIIGVGACVTRDVPDNAVVEGPSGRIIGTRKGKGR